MILTYFTLKHRALVITLLFGLGLMVALLAGLANFNAQRQAMRGVAQGLPGPVSPVGLPRLGVNVALESYDVATLNQTLSPLLGGELRWLRQTFPWARIEPQPGQFEWATWDALFAGLQGYLEKDTNGQSQALMLAVLDGAPDWFQPPQTQPATTNAHFARFAAEFARRYGRWVDYYQVWDEPNLGEHWNGQVEPAAYADMLRQAGDAIRANDPGAVIVLAGLAPTIEQSSANMADWLFLRRLYEIGAGDFFDVAAGKPYGFSSEPYDRRVEAETLNFSHILLMREEMERHGDAGKALWATQWGWNALPANWSGSPSLWGQSTPDQQANYTCQAIQRAAGEWPWMTALMIETFQPAAPLDHPRWGFALVGQDGAPRPVYQAMLTSAQALHPPGAGYYPAAVRAGQVYTGSALANFHGRWRFGELGADWLDESGAKVTFSFNGVGLGLHVRRAADRAHMLITIDGQPANALPRDSRGAFLQLIPPDFTQADVVVLPVARNLPPGPHQVEIITERGWNQWSFIGWSVEAQTPPGGVNVLNVVLALCGGGCLLGAIWNGRLVNWLYVGRALSGRYAGLSKTAQLGLTLLAAGTMYLGAAMTWGQSASDAFRRLGDGGGLLAVAGAGALFYFSPWLLLTLLSGLALFALIMLRLEMGLALAVLCAPFFFLPRALFERVFSMVEIVSLMCLASWLRLQLATLFVASPDGCPAAPNANLALSAPHRLAHAWGWLKARMSALDWAVLAFVGVSLASLPTTEYPHVAARELRVIVLEPALLYLMLRTTLPRDGQPALWRIVDALVLAGALVALIGLFQYAFNVNLITAEAGARRLRAVYGSPNNAALFLGRVLPIAVAVALMGEGRRRVWYALAIAPLALAILLTFSKGALLLGIPVALAFILLAWLGRRAVGPLLGLALVGGVGLALLMQVPQVGARLGVTGITSFFRLSLWQSALMMVRDHPWLGVGLDNFLYVYRGRYMLPEAWAEPFLSHPHNVVLDYAARLGLVGLACGVALQVAFWKTAWPLRRRHDRMQRALAVGLMASMADFLAHGLVDASFFVVDLAYVFCVTLALVGVLAGSNRATSKINHESHEWTRVKNDISC